MKEIINYWCLSSEERAGGEDSYLYLRGDSVHHYMHFGDGAPPPDLPRLLPWNTLFFFGEWWRLPLSPENATRLIDRLKGANYWIDYHWDNLFQALIDENLAFLISAENIPVKLGYHGSY